MSRTKPGPRRRFLLAATIAAAVAPALAGCSSVLSELPQSAGGLPADAPARPAIPADYPAVNDVPNDRAPIMSDKDRQKLEADLAAARAETARRAGTTAEAAATGTAAKATGAAASAATATR